MDRKILEKYNYWLESEFIDKVDRERLADLKNNEKEIEDRFYSDLEFGTGGMRAVMGLGTNRINRYTIQKATQGLANYILKNKVEGKDGVAIAYDCRLGSEQFAKDTALVLAGNGIKTYLFKTLHSTPELSFAVRELNCVSGIVITASHNPKEYNGYKVYWSDGAQVIEPQATGIIEEVNKVERFEQIKTISEEKAIDNGTLIYISEDMDTKFIEAVKKQALHRDLKGKDEFKIVYTPLHGTGGRPIKRVFEEMGFNSVYVVKEQELPDGNFPTCEYANPEDSKVFELSIKLAEEIGSKICMANDPDADRIGVALKDKNGEWRYPNGNQIGVALLNYLIESRKDISPKSAVISTIVSTPMLDTICKANNLKLFRTLTGFKYVGEKIREFEEGKVDYEYLLGFEESYGYLIGTHSRDKDAVVATLLIAEMELYYNSKGSSILEELEKLYKKYGYFKEGIISVTKLGQSGIKEIEEIMNYLREEITDELLDKKIISKQDFNIENGELPKSNVIQFILEDGTYITARPSGTEPKIKYYFGISDETDEKAEIKLKEMMEKFNRLVGEKK